MVRTIAMQRTRLVVVVPSEGEGILASRVLPCLEAGSRPCATSL